MRFNIFRKLLLFSILLALLPLASLGIFSLKSSENELKSAINDELIQTAQSIAERIDHLVIDQWQAPLELMAGTLANPELPASAKLALLTNISALPDIISLQVSNSGGGTPALIVQDQISAHIAEAGLRAADLLLIPHHRFYAQGEDGIYSGLSEHLDVPPLDLLHLLAPIGGDQDEATALLSARINLERLRERIEQHPFNANGTILLLDPHGKPMFGAVGEILDDNPFTRQLESLSKGAGASVGVMPFTTAAGQATLGGYALPATLPWTVVVARDANTAYLPVTQMRERLLIWALLAGIVATLAAWFFARRISRPIVSIEEAVQRVGAGDLETQVPEITRRDEIGHLAIQINVMIRGLRDRDHIKDVFGRYQNVEVMRTLLETPGALALGGERREITAMMSDLRGFTAISEKYSPEQVVTMLNRYFEPMVEIIQKHGGTIDDILGDGMFIMFGAPLRMQDHASRAVACAIDMQLAMEGVNKANLRDGLPPLEMGIGLNAGEVIIGNIGSEKRAKFSAIGSPVNMAARVESYTTGGQLLVSSSVYQPLAEILEVGKQMEVKAKGLKGTMEVIEVLGIAGDYNLRLPDQNQPLRDLASPLAIRFMPLSGKDISAEPHPGWLIAANGLRGEIETLRPLEPLVDIKFSLATDGLNEDELYAKVEERREGGNRIRFTCLSEAARRFLESGEA
jgi:class 3 adenylate cyclase